MFEKIKNQENPSEKERHTFAMFLSLMLTRVPNYRRNVEKTMGRLLKQIAMMDASNIDWLKGNMQRYEQVTGESLEVSPEEFQKTMPQGDYELSTSAEFSLRMMSIDLSAALLDKTWFY